MSGGFLGHWTLGGGSYVMWDRGGGLTIKYIPIC